MSTGTTSLETYTVDPLPPLTSLVGREREIDDVVRRLGTRGLLTLTGAPGVGKSRLAVEAASRLQIDSPLRSPPVVNVDSLASEGQVAVAVAKAVDQAQRQGRAKSADSAVLIVLDDCDRWLGACAEAASALLARGLHILATSRERLGVADEAVWPVPPLSVPASGHDQLPEVLTDSEAVVLFCERAAAAHRGFMPTRETAPVIADICRRLQGIPLAIELAAASLRTYSLPEVLAHLGSPFALLTDGPRSAPPRQRSLWACLEWSYERLPAAEQVLLERLAVFPLGFSEEAAAAVCAPEGMAHAEVTETIRALVNKSLVEVDSDAGGTRYRFLDMTRRFAAEKVAAVGEESTLQDKHARWCVQLVGLAGDARQRRRWLSRLVPHRADIEAALEWSLAAPEPDAAPVLGLAAARLRRAEGEHREADASLERGVALHPNPAGAALPLLVAAGVAAAARGELSLAVAHLERAVRAAEEGGQLTEAARARLALCSIHALATGDRGPLEAERALDRSGEPAVAADALIAFGWAHLHAGETAVAVDGFASCLARAGAGEDELGRVRALVGLGTAQVCLGRYGDAEATLAQGLDAARELGEAHAAAMALGWLGESARRQGAADLARRWFTRGLELARQAGHPHPLSLCLLGLGRLALDEGDLATAIEDFEAALAAARRGPISPLLAPCLCALAEVAPTPPTARARWEEALRTARDAGDRTGEAGALYGLGRLNHGQGELTMATRRYRDALVLQAQVGDPAAMAESIEALAGLAVTRGDCLAAARLIGAAESLRRAHGCARAAVRSQEYAAVEEAARAGLGDEGFVVARQQAAALSVEEAVVYVVKHRGKRVPRPTAGWAVLTNAEDNVAQLVAEGHTNKEVARQLGIAPATVKAHLRNIYTKLDVQSRAALGAEVHRRRVN